MRVLLPFVALLAMACGSSDAAAPPVPPDGAAGGAGSAGAPVADYGAWGSAPVGHATFTITDASRSRALPVEVFYPADESARAAADVGTPFADFEPPGDRHDTLAGLVAAAPAGCVRTRTHSAADLPIASGTYPLVVFSHCSGCMRYSSANLAEHLASRGFVVAAADHVGNTIWDALAGTNADVDADFLATRVADVRYVVDAALGGDAAVPPWVTAAVDPQRIGIFGHSYGGLTTGLAVQLDPRFRAGFSVAAPMALFDPADMTQMHAPLFFLLATEDNSIGELGVDLMRSNWRQANPPAELVEVRDAGHWSFSDIPGLTSDFAPGCGHGLRMPTDDDDGGEDFAYLDNETARGIGAGYVDAFFASQLGGDAAADAYSSTAHPDGVVTVSRR